MVVHKGVKRSSHRLQTSHIVGNLKVVVVIVTGVERLVKLIVCHGMKAFQVHPAVIFAVDHLAHEPEIRFLWRRSFPELFMNPKSRTFAQSRRILVDIEVVDPELDRVEQDTGGSPGSRDLSRGARNVPARPQ